MLAWCAVVALGMRVSVDSYTNSSAVSTYDVQRCEGTVGCCCLAARDWRLLFGGTLLCRQDVCWAAGAEGQHQHNPLGLGVVEGDGSLVDLGEHKDFPDGLAVWICSLRRRSSCAIVLCTVLARDSEQPPPGSSTSSRCVLCGSHATTYCQKDSSRQLAQRGKQSWLAVSCSSWVAAGSGFWAGGDMAHCGMLLQPADSGSCARETQPFGLKTGRQAAGKQVPGRWRVLEA